MEASSSTIKARIAALYKQYRNGTISSSDRQLLLALLLNPDHEEIVHDILGEAMEEVIAAMENESADAIAMNEVRAEIVYEKIWKIIGEREAPVRQIHRVHFMKRFGWVAAASVLLLAGVLWFVTRRSDEAQLPVTAKVIDVKAPVSNRASISLGDGRTVYLDSVSNGALAKIGDVDLVKLGDGKIMYSGSTGEVRYHTLNNPRGSKVIDIGLSDGTHVWLNAGSSLTYPVAFASGGDRKVSMKGEAYFEVAKNKGVGFVVEKEEVSVRVLGTHFNVKAYDNEPDLKVTLLEGSVRVQQKQRALLLKPGEQAVVNSDAVSLVANVDAEEALAWKNGFTSFHGADISAVLRELERWYNIETVVKGEMKQKRFRTETDRAAPLRDILQVIFDDNQIKYEYDAASRRLTIL